MKKLIFSLIMSFITLFLLWFIVGWANFGDDIFDYHLDVYQTFNKIVSFDLDENFGLSLYDLLKSFKSTLNMLNDSTFFGRLIGNAFFSNGTTTAFSIIIGALNAIIDPIVSIASSFIYIIYLVVILLYILYTAIFFIISIYEFIFNPVFVDNNGNVVVYSIDLLKYISQGSLEKAKNLFGFAFQGLHINFSMSALCTWL